MSCPACLLTHLHRLLFTPATGCPAPVSPTFRQFFLLTNAINVCFSLHVSAFFLFGMCMLWCLSQPHRSLLLFLAFFSRKFLLSILQRGKYLWKHVCLIKKSVINITKKLVDLVHNLMDIIGNEIEKSWLNCVGCCHTLIQSLFQIQLTRTLLSSPKLTFVYFTPSCVSFLRQLALVCACGTCLTRYATDCWATILSSVISHCDHWTVNFDLVTGDACTATAARWEYNTHFSLSSALLSRRNRNLCRHIHVPLGIWRSEGRQDVHVLTPSHSPLPPVASQLLACLYLWIHRVFILVCFWTSLCFMLWTVRPSLQPRYRLQRNPLLLSYHPPQVPLCGQLSAAACSSLFSKVTCQL